MIAHLAEDLLFYIADFAITSMESGDEQDNLSSHGQTRGDGVVDLPTT